VLAKPITRQREVLWHSRFGIMSVVEVMWFDSLNNATVSESSNLSVH